MQTTTSKIPLIRLSSINPFLVELKRRGVDYSGILRRWDLPAGVPVSAELFVSALTVYEIVEESAIVADDPGLGYTIGRNLDLNQWDPIAKAVTDAETVGDMLRFFVVNALDHSSSTDFYVRTKGARTTFGFERVLVPPFTPSQNDAFYFGFFDRLLRQAAGVHWDRNEVLARVANPAVIPRDPENARLAQGDRSGMQISFPTAWQFSRLAKSAFSIEHRPDVVPHIPATLVDSVRIALQPHLHDTELSVEKAAKICGYEKRKLARLLSAQGTTIAKEVAALRAAVAREKLAESKIRIAEIGTAVGFKDPTVFSRAFKNWTGQSPQEYRRNNRV